MDNLINDKIDLLIMSATKSRDTVRTETLREIKTAFMKWKTDAKNVGQKLTTEIEQGILDELVKSYKKAIADFEKMGRNDLIDSYKPQMEIIKEFLPKEPTEEDVVLVFETLKSEGMEPTMKNMGSFIKEIKNRLTGVDGAMVAKYVKENLLYGNK